MGCEGGLAGAEIGAGGKGLNVVWGGWKPKTEAAEKGTRPACWPRLANRDCEFAKRSLCLLKASRAGRGGKPANNVLGSNSFSSASSFIKCLGS